MLLLVVKNYFSYIRCLAENYLDCLTLQNSKLSLAEINAIFTRCKARDARFTELWKNLISAYNWEVFGQRTFIDGIPEDLPIPDYTKLKYER